MEFDSVGKVLGRYELRAGLGRGRFGAVYRAWDPLEERAVAVKVLSSGWNAQRFQDEMKIVRRELRGHPNVREIFDLGVWNHDATGTAIPWMAMELLEGETLAESLRRRRGENAAGRSAPDVLELFAPAIDAIAFAHDKGIVHGALDPAKVFLVRDGERTVVKVLDVGLTKVFHDGVPSFSMQYGAPEQFEGRTIGKQTDVFAAGLILTELLTDRAPLSELEDRSACTHAVLDPSRRPTPRALGGHAPESVERVIARAVSVGDKDRHPDARSLLAAFREGVGKGGTQPMTARAMPPPQATPAPPAPAWTGAQAGAAPYPSAPPVGAAPYPSAPPVGAAPYPSGPRLGPAPPGPPPFTPGAPGHPLGMPGPPPSSGSGAIAAIVAVVIAAFVALGVLGGMAFVGVRAYKARKKAPVVLTDAPDDVGADSPVPVTRADPAWGAPDALVTVVLFSDFQCPFCARVRTSLDQVKSTYGESKVRIVWKHNPLPFHTNAKPAAEAAAAVHTLGGNTAFWGFHDSAFDNQRELGTDAYERWANQVGVRPQALRAELASKRPERKVVADQDLAKTVRATGTPSFRINGVEVSGAQPFDKFKTVIDAELAKAEAKLASGTPRARVSTVLTKENFTSKKDDDDDKEDKEDTTTVWRVPVGDSPVLGPADAPVTLVEFADFQCPYCKRVEPTLQGLRQRYPTNLRIVWKNQPLPFHPRAYPAAELALEVKKKRGDQGFWLAHDKIFESQPKLEDADLEEIGAGLGIARTKVRGAIQGATHKAEIDRDVDLADDLSASGTPHFFVNGRRIVGAQPTEKFTAVIDEEMRKFEGQSRFKRGDYYDALMKEAKGPPELERKTPPPIPADAPFIGDKNATVVIQEFADFQCPFCARSTPTTDEILKTYDRRVKIVWRDKPLPMHADAALAAEAAREAYRQAGNDGFWKMHKKLFANQQRLKRADLEEYAKDIGLDSAKFAAALDSHAHKAAVEADDRAGTAAGISGTPTFFVNGYVVSGAQPFSKFKKVIDRALTEPKP